MNLSALDAAIADVPAGDWAVGVSGGADSVALVRLLAGRGDLRLVVAHLNHQTRGRDSDEDERFVGELANQLKLPVVIARRNEMESQTGALPGNPSARYRALRRMLFAQVVSSHQLDGVILAHHADDQAETVLHRLLRNSGYAGLAGMSRRASIDGLTIFRPLLSTRRQMLREYLTKIGQTWREDASNRSAKYLRNRLRAALSERDELIERLLDLSRTSAELRRWVRNQSPKLPERIPVSKLADLPHLLARDSARRWLIARGVPPEELTPAVLSRLIEMASDAASPARAMFPGGIRIRRRGGIIAVD